MQGRYAHCLFCEDIREEIGNTTSFIGVLGPDLLLEDRAPDVVSRLGIVVWCCTPRDHPFEHLTIRIDGPGGRILSVPLGSSELEDARRDGRRDVLEIVVTLMIRDLAIGEPGNIEVSVDTDSETLSAGLLSLREPEGDAGDSGRQG